MGPLALKRELRQHEAEIARLEAIAQVQQAELTRLRKASRPAKRSLCPPRPSTWKPKKLSWRRRINAIKLARI